MRRGHLSEVELTEYADGELAVQRLGAAEAHLQRCPVCSALLSRVRETAAAAGRVGYRRAPAGVRERARTVLAEPSLAVSCRQAKAMMHERLDRRLSLLAAVPLEIHLNGCQACRSELAALSGATRAVRTVANVEAPARVREQVLAAYRRQPRRAVGSPRWRPAVAVAFAALAVGAVTLMKPSVTPPTDRRVAQRTEPPAGLPSRSLTIAVAVPVTSAGDAQEQVIPEAGQTAAEAPLNSGRERFSRRMTALPAKGPTPGIAASEADSPRVALPAALRALRAVAKSASPDWEVQRAMETAGERFATLDSEAMSESMLAALPSAIEGGSGSDGDASRDMLAPATGDTVPAQDNGGGQSNDSSAPVREGASLNVGPFV